LRDVFQSLFQILEVNLTALIKFQQTKQGKPFHHVLFVGFIMEDMLDQVIKGFLPQSVSDIHVYLLKGAEANIQGMNFCGSIFIAIKNAEYLWYIILDASTTEAKNVVLACSI